MLLQYRPEQALFRAGDDLYRGKIDEDGAEQRLGNPHAADNEILPAGLDRFMGAVQTDQEHRRQGRPFDRYPENPEIVGRQGHQHGKEKALIHRVVESHSAIIDPADGHFMLHVRSGKDGGGHADKGIQQNEIDIEAVDVEKLAGGKNRPLVEDLDGQKQGGDKGYRTDDQIDGFRRMRRWPIKARMTDAGKRKEQGGGKGIHFSTSVRWLRRSVSRLPISARI